MSVTRVVVYVQKKDRSSIEGRDTLSTLGSNVFRAFENTLHKYTTAIIEIHTDKASFLLEND